MSAQAQIPWVHEAMPEDLDAEKTILATLCAPGNDRQAAMESAKLCADDFVHPAHKALFLGLKDILANHEEVSPNALKMALEKRKQLDQVGGFHGIVERLQCAEVSKPENLTDRLQELRKKREIILLGHRLMSWGLDPSEDVGAITTKAQNSLREIGVSSRVSGGTSAIEILENMANQEPLRSSKTERGGYWGIATLDDFAHIPSGEFTTIGARPGIGKTMLMVQSACASARRGMRPLIVSMELKRGDLKARIASHLTGIPLSIFKAGCYDKATIEAVRIECGVLQNLRFHDPSAGTPWTQIEAQIRYEVDRYGVDMVLLDQFDKIGRPAITKGSSEAYAFGAVSQGVMALCQELSIGSVLLCQIRGDADGGIPKLADHADSDRPGKDAGLVVHFWRDKNSQIKGVIQKNRNGGHVGQYLDFDFDGEKQRVRAIARETRDQNATEEWV
jgi:replicative DNA helicase